MKLSTRLHTIANIISRNYTHIWDCCCDHGQLGAHLLKSHPDSEVHFVDSVPRIMAELEDKLTLHLDAESARASCWCMDAGDIPVDRQSGKQLVIIAGVGGELTAELVLKIAAKDANTDFVLCPVYHTFSLRETLVKSDFSLIDEALVKENKRFYEIIYVTQQDNSNTLSVAGSKIWQADSIAKRKLATDYLGKLVTHYQNTSKGGETKAVEALTAYKNILLQLT